MRRIAKNILFVFSGDVLSRLLGFFATIWLARVLGVAGFGALSFAFTFLGYALIFTDLGLSTIGTREIAKAPLLSKDYITKIIPLKFLLAATAFTIITILTFLIKGMMDMRLLIILYCLSVFPYALSLEWFFRGIEEMRNIGISMIMSYGSYLFLVLLFVRSTGNIYLVPILWFTGSAVAALYLGLMVRRRSELKVVGPRLEIRTWEILKHALPIGIGTVMTQIYFNFDITMLGFIKGTTDAGLYTVAYKLLMFLLLVDRVFSMVILPLISRYYKESIKKLEEILSLAARAVITVVIPICAGGTLLAMPIIRFIFGQGYTSSTPVLQILIWTLAITTIGSIYTQGLIGTGQEKRYAVAMVTGTVSNIILNVIMIPRLGITGAALATICAELIMFYLMYRVFHRVVKFRLFTFFGKPIFASAIMCAILYFLRSLNVILLVFIGAVIYTFLLYIMKGITKEDIRVVLGNKE